MKRSKENNNNQLCAFCPQTFSFHQPLQRVICNFLDCHTSRIQISRILLYPNKYFSVKQKCCVCVCVCILFYLSTSLYLFKTFFQGRTALRKIQNAKGKVHNMKEIIINQFKHSLTKLPYDIGSGIKRYHFTLKQKTIWCCLPGRHSHYSQKDDTDILYYGSEAWL